MAGEGLIHVQRTFRFMPARKPAAGSRRPSVRLCKPKAKRQKPESRGQKRVRIRSEVRPQMAAWLRRIRKDVLARLAHTGNMYADPRRAGGRSLAGDCYVEAALAGDPRILLDTIVESICKLQGVGREMWAVTEPKATTALPGTPEKVEEMRKRQEMFQALHSDWDAKRS
jgi:hypothetical protein